MLAALGPGCGDGEPSESGRGGWPPPRGASEATVERVVDGDTLKLARVGSVRLIGVDTPEVFGGAECYGREASSFLKRSLPPGRRVSYRLGVDPRDRYGRALAYVWLEDGRFLNGELVEKGYAVPLTVPPNVEFARLLAAAARRARAAARGLWAAGTCAGDADRPAG